MADSLVESIYEAIQVADERALKRCLQRATIETVLEFESVHQKSPLDLCVELGGLGNVGLMRQLVASGLVDLTQLDSEGLTVLQHAQKAGDGELVGELIKMQIGGADDATACYRMMKHRSLELFRVFLAKMLKKTTEADTFQSIAAALVKVNVKNFHLPEELRVFLQWKLSDYGYRHLVGSWPGAKDPYEWKGQMEIVDECWRAIRTQYDNRMYNDIDDQLMHRLHVIHNQLYLLKYNKFLDHLPLTEVVFCLAVFISIFKNSDDFEEYRLLVNKCHVMEFLRMVARQLPVARASMEEAARELRVIMADTKESQPTDSDRLAELWEQIKAMGVAENDNWMKGKVKEWDKLKTANATDQAAITKKLIKDIGTKMKQLNKGASNRTDSGIPKPSKPSDITHRVMAQICERLPHVTHPENVAKKLIAEVNRNRTIDDAVAEVIRKETFDLTHLVRGCDRRAIRRAKRCYVRTKQLYSLLKIMAHCEQIYMLDPNDGTVFNGSFKRLVQVIGETVKNTANSPNLPGKVSLVVGDMLSAMFPDINKSLREIVSHDISLARTLVSDKLERSVFRQTLEHIRLMRVMFFLLFSVAVEEARFSLYGTLYRCQSVEQVRSLLVYVGKIDKLTKMQTDCFKIVKEYFDEVKQLLEELRKKPLAENEHFPYIESLFKDKYQLLTDFEKTMESEADLGFVKLRKVCFASDDLQTVRRILDWILTLRCPSNFFARVRSYWISRDVELSYISFKDFRLNLLAPSVLPDILKYSSAAIRCAEENDYILHTRELARTIGLGVEDENKVNELHKELVKLYYGNIFNLDNKWKILNELKSKNKDLLRDLVVERIIKGDQDRLQQMFDDRRERLRKVLEKNGLDSVERLGKWSSLPPCVYVAIQYLQLELTQMLTGAGYFGDSFHYVKHRIPMIQGTNYRNYLAHEGISYNLLSDSSKEMVVINAYVIAKTDVRLYEKRGSIEDSVGMQFPTVQQTHEWVAEQEQLMRAFRAKDVGQMHAAMLAGGELRSNFCSSPNLLHHESNYRFLTQLCDLSDPGPWLEVLLNRYYETFAEESKDPENIFREALVRRDFVKAFVLMGKLQIIRHEIYEWPDFVPRLRKTGWRTLFKSSEHRYKFLGPLIEHGNERSVRALLPHFSDICSDKTLDPLGDAIMYGVRTIAQLLLAQTSLPRPNVLQSAIITHMPVEMLRAIMAKATITDDCYCSMLKTAVRAKNGSALSYLLEQEQYREQIPKVLGKCYELAAITSGQHSKLQLILENHPVWNPAGLARIMHQAARRQRWKSVQLLLDYGVPTDTLYSIDNSIEDTVLLLLAKYGQSRLLRRVKSMDRKIYGTVTEHPLAVAIRNGMDSDRVVVALKQLGFDWLDSSTLLHAKMQFYDTQGLERTWAELDKCLLMRSCVDQTDRVGLALNVLQRWKMIAYVEQLTGGATSLLRALQKMPSSKITQRKMNENHRIDLLKEQLKQASCQETSEQKQLEIDEKKAAIKQLEKSESEKRSDLVKTLLDRSRAARKVEGLGVLGGMVFQQGSTIVVLGKEDENKSVNLQSSCEAMMLMIESTANLSWCSWHEFTVDAGETVTFNVLPLTDEPVEPLEHASCKLTDSGSLPDMLTELQAICSAMFNESVLICATVSTRGGVVHYWQIEDSSCVFDVRPENSEVDLTDLLHTRDQQGRTALHWCLANPFISKAQEGEFQRRIAQLLLENGANPLLVDDAGTAPLHWTLAYPTHPGIVWDAMEECLRRDLRGSQGETLLEVTDGTNRVQMIHLAVQNGRSDILQRLLDLHVDANVANVLGSTPAHMVVQVPHHNARQMMKLLLDYDRTLVDAVDMLGRTVLHCAAETDSDELMDLIMTYNPKQTALTGKCSPVGIALQRGYTEWAERFLSYVGSISSEVGDIINSFKK